MKKDFNDDNIYQFIYVVKKYLDQYGYSSRINEIDFYKALDEIGVRDIYESSIEIVQEIVDYLEKFVTPRENYSIWKRGISISFRRNVEGYFMLNRIVNHFDDFDLDKEADIFYRKINKRELFYLYFELSYRLNYGIPEFIVDNIRDFINIANTFDDNSSLKWWFRGHSNKSWDLVPTYLRNIDRTDTRIIDYNELGKIYRRYGLKQKYDNVFGYSSLDYNFLSYMQHSTSYSPMIDFTTKFWVATSFALSNKSNVNDFNNNDAAIICLNNNSKSSIENKIKNYKVGVLSNKKWTSKDIKIILSGMGVMYNPFAEVYSSINRMNDRMKYQHGIFIMYDNFISFPTHSVPIDFSSVIFKIVISKDLKEDLYKYVYKNKNELRQLFLLNPYQYFAE